MSTLYSTDLLRNLSNVCDNFNFWRVFVLCIDLNFDSFIVEIMTAMYVFNFTSWCTRKRNKRARAKLGMCSLFSSFIQPDLAFHFGLYCICFRCYRTFCAQYIFEILLYIRVMNDPARNVVNDVIWLHNLIWRFQTEIILKGLVWRDSSIFFKTCLYWNCTIRSERLS